MEGFKQINAAELSDNFIKTIGSEWMLITAGDGLNVNTMTASWGAMGELWGQHTAICFVRPQRHTFKFTEASERLTLSFFDEQYKSALSYCGTHSGSDEPKIENASLSVVLTDDGTPAIAQARLVLDCRKMYTDFIRPDNFTDTALIDKFYPNRDFHRVYVTKIEKAYIKID